MTEGLETGKILKGIGGFYYVQTAQGVIECHARGKFRKTVGKPMIGDAVTLSLQPDGTGYLQEIYPRSNSLIRPAVANLDMLIAIANIAPPKTDPFLIDKVIAIAESKHMLPCVVFNKCDLMRDDALAQMYRDAGIATFALSAQTGEGVEEFCAFIADKTVAFAGNSGVGKSSLLNRILPHMEMETGEISSRIGRGKHTTRHVELVPFRQGFIADTPGFSSFETEQMDLVRKDELEYAFREFAPYLLQCKFTGCAHVKEQGCAVRQAVAEGKIALSRHASYAKLYESVKDMKEWEIKKQR